MVEALEKEFGERFGLKFSIGKLTRWNNGMTS